MRWYTSGEEEFLKGRVTGTGVADRDAKGGGDFAEDGENGRGIDGLVVANREGEDGMTMDKQGGMLLI